jgi:hypothetical protein
MSEPVTTGPSDPQEPATGGAEAPDAGDSTNPRPKRRRGSRGGRNRNRNRTTSASSEGRASGDGSGEGSDDGSGAPDQPELPERTMEGRPQNVEAAERARVRKPDPSAP